ncbi:MAG: F0F1 ATP synthase subunit B [Arcanobacterium sp.]|nr:F0F1 ATP synthase subunit B [Arcanobacterium sp.]
MSETTVIFASPSSAEGSTFNLLVPAIPDLIWGSVAFAIVAFVIYRFAWPTFSQMLDERGEKIEQGLQAAELARQEIATERENLAGELSAAQREAAQVRETAAENAKAIVSEAQLKARSDAEAILAAAQTRITADTETAARVLRSDIGSLATDLAGRIIGEAVTDQEMSARVIDRFLDELETSLAAKNLATPREN